MACHECYRQEKLVQYRLKGQNHPFVDDTNLQIYLPGIDSLAQEQEAVHSCHIYSYYATYSPSYSLYPSTYQTELNRAMSEARQAYETWKKMQQKLHQTIKKCYPSLS